MKAKWLLQSDVFDENLERFTTELTSQGYEYKIVKYVPFQTIEYNQFPDDDCVIFYGSLTLASQIQRQKLWIPGTYYDSNNFKCSVYYNYFGKHLFNESYIMMPFSEIMRLHNHVDFPYNHQSHFFIRPDSGFKEFTGQVVSTDGFENEYVTKIENLNINGDLDKTMLCVVAADAHIKMEWRVVIGDKKFITGSQYKKNLELDVSTDCPEEVVEFAEKVANCEWEPARVYVMDIAVDESDVLGMLEINSFSCAGLYNCDLSKIVSEISRIAEQEWKEYQEI